MKISIVTISFNQGKFLKQCIDSVLSQDVANLEYIIVDPGSTDGSRNLIDSYGAKIKKIYRPDNGPADGLKNGFNIATGNIYGFINADDYLLPNALKKVQYFFAKNKLKTFVSGNGFILSVDSSFKEIRPGVMSKFSCAYGTCTIFQQSTFFPAAFYKKVGGFNVDNKTCWDAELFIDFILSGYKHINIKENLAVFRIHSESISGSGKLLQSYDYDRKKLFKKIMKRNFYFFDFSLSFFLRLIKKIISIYDEKK